MSAGISYSPESMAYTLFDGTNSLKLPNWAHRVIHEEFEREVRPLNSKIEILSDALALARDENAKLRELVAELYEDQCADGDQWRYRARMRELGIEADDG